MEARGQSMVSGELWVIAAIIMVILSVERKTSTVNRQTPKR